jgi:hypothetical protein
MTPEKRRGQPGLGWPDQGDTSFRLRNDAFIKPSERKGKPVKNGAQARWRERNPLARWAHVATARALQLGLIEMRPCEVCGDPKSEAHHPDYHRPLLIKWFCRQHHRAEHKRLARLSTDNSEPLEGAALR